MSASAGQREVASAQSWRLIAPIGPIEAGELQWYLQQYAVWPSHYFAHRAAAVECNLVAWGRALYEAALPPAHTADVLQAWTRIDRNAGRRFSILIDPAPEDGTSEAQRQAESEATTVLLGLPWELLHDGAAHLFQGARPTRVRRRLRNTRVLDVSVVNPPIRILLVSPRPQDAACGYIDHRASALPLVDAMEQLPDQVQLSVLCPATLPALTAELERARAAHTPYHVVHFDGHGVYDRRVGLGGLCFEHPDDAAKLDDRRHLTVYTDTLGPLLRDHRIPLVVLDACQSAQAEQASESVASELLKLGVASVVAMSHSVLVETSRRFVTAFYRALAGGKRVGDAMLAGQRTLKDDPSRGHVFGAGPLRLEDWFVPVLYQEKDDPQLFRALPALQTVADFRQALEHRLGALPPAPETSFVGRGRELLALERMLFAPRPPGAESGAQARYAVLRGQGGEGKTALAAEFARWMVRSQRVRRAAFVSVETHGDARALLDALGRRLVGATFTAAGDLEHATREVERALREQATLLVVDNMESVLLPPYVAQDTPAALSAEAAQALTAILELCARLARAGETRLVFTSRETLPPPFDGVRQQRELQRLAVDDAVKLVERTLDVAGGAADANGATDAARDAIERLVEAVHGHARTLSLLAPALRAHGVEATRARLTELMADMARRFPAGHPHARERSLFASVELSLQRLAPQHRAWARVLGVFHGGVNLDVLARMMAWEAAQVAALAADLIATGLATPNRYNHLSLHPALCPHLRGQLEAAERDALTARWVAAMRAHVDFLARQQHQDAAIATTLSGLELPNLVALLEHMAHAGEPEACIALTSDLHSLLGELGKPRLLARVYAVRDAVAGQLEARGGAWSHARFLAAYTRIEQQLAAGRLAEAQAGAHQLVVRARAAGAAAYAHADYDLALACAVRARALRRAGDAQQALPLLDEARRHFESIAQARAENAAEKLASACLAEQGYCLLNLGRLDAAAAAYEECTRRAEQCGAARDIAVAQGQLGSVRLAQGRNPEALAAYDKAREYFSTLDEPGSVAISWHNIGMVHQAAGQPDAAAEAYRASLAIRVRLGDIAGQARTLGQLGSLYGVAYARPEEAVAFHRQAADKFAALGDVAGEGVARNNLAATLHRLGDLDEARREIHRAIACKHGRGHAGSIWNAHAILAAIETEAGQAAAAAAAQRAAVAAYLAYRHAGGENHAADGRQALTVSQALAAGQGSEAAEALRQIAVDPETADWLRPFIHALRAIVAGSRDRGLAEAPGLRYTSAAELLVLLDALDAAP